jgi:hypothetical protein
VEERDYVTVPLTDDTVAGGAPQPGRRGRGRGRGTRGGEGAEAAVVRESVKDRRELLAHIVTLRDQRNEAARLLRFEEAAKIRDQVFRLEKADMELR